MAGWSQDTWTAKESVSSTVILSIEAAVKKKKNMLVLGCIVNYSEYGTGVHTNSETKNQGLIKRKGMQLP